MIHDNALSLSAAYNRSSSQHFCRSTKTTPFELLTGTKMRLKADTQIQQMLNAEMIQLFNDDRDVLRKQAKQQILKVQAENKRRYNLRRRPASKYDLVAIIRTQLGPGLKLKPKYLGPYRIVRVKLNDTYDVTKDSVFSEGPRQTSTCAEYLKPWIPYDDDEDDAFEANAV